RTFFHNMEYGKSLENYSTALSLKPNCSKALRGRAKTYRALGRKGLALADDKHAKKIERELETT
ncbi:MAG: hypothetical protein II536_02025, partial [Clostridia bacterium]|nr:hypothetical protein [Clostridia bacterium]